MYQSTPNYSGVTDTEEARLFVHAANYTFHSHSDLKHKLFSPVAINENM